MRAGPVIAGCFLLIIGLTAVVIGGMMRPMDDLCAQLRECDSDAFLIGLVGEGVFLGGALTGVAGVGIAAAGIVAERKEARVVPVTSAVGSSRACPHCGAAGSSAAKFCQDCGAAVAPTLTR